MRFLARLSLRARPALSRAPALMPKGVALRQPVPVFRAGEPVEEEEQAQPLRRAAARTIRRAEEPQTEEEETQRTSAPTAGEEDEQEQPAMARRASNSLRRADEKPEEEEPAQPLRRAAAPAREPDEEEPAQAARLIRRAEEVPLEEGEKPLRQPFQQDLSPGASPLPPDMANEEEPPAMQALRRDIAPFAPPPRAATPTADDPGFAGSGVESAEPFPAKFGGEEVYIPGPPAGFETHFTGALGGSGAGASAPQRPQVIIDQVDVLIHEPAAPAVSARPAFDAGRAMRARYLRRL